MTKINFNGLAPSEFLKQVGKVKLELYALKYRQLREEHMWKFMMNVDEKYLFELQALPQKGDARISIFIPVHWGDSSPEVLFRALVKTEDELLEKDGYGRQSMPEGWVRL